VSDSTPRVDSREKVIAYRTIPTLREYRLVSQVCRGVLIFRRKLDWAMETYNEGIVRLDCLE
jgi:hypothetical protein